MSKEADYILNAMNDAGVNGYFYDEASNSFRLKIQIINKSNNEPPAFKNAGDAGMDIRANITEGNNLIVQPGEYIGVPTGIYMKVPENYEIQVRPRSGLAIKYGITVLNTPGTIDSGYNGEIKVILINHGKEPFEIKHGDRIAQLVVNNVMNKNFIKTFEVKEFKKTERDTSGFGSTGTH